MRPSYRTAVSVGAVIIAVAAAMMVWFELYSGDIPPQRALKGGALSEAQEKSIDITMSLMTLINTWALGVIGATAFFLKLNAEKELSLRRTDLVISFTVILLCVFSLFFGHLAVARTAELLSLDQLSMRDDGLRAFLRYQYLAALAGLGLFGFHIIQFFWARLER